MYLRCIVAVILVMIMLTVTNGYFIDVNESKSARELQEAFERDLKQKYSGPIMMTEALPLYKKITQLQTDNQQQQADIRQLQTDNQQLQTDNQQLQADNQQQQTDNQQLQTDNQQQQTDIRQLETDKRQLETQLQQTRAQLEASTSTGPQFCEDLLKQGNTADGVYTIRSCDLNPVKVWCDMTNGGWIVINKRYDGSLNFSKNFEEYSQGFGELSGEHWLGLNTMRKLTENGNWHLRFDLESHDNDHAWAEYGGFSVGEGPGFILNFDNSTYQGNAGNSLSLNQGMKFSTYDRDQDTWSVTNCAGGHFNGGGWWYRSCAGVTTTGMPYSGNYSIIWEEWKKWVPLKSAIIKIKKF